MGRGEETEVPLHQWNGSGAALNTAAKLQFALEVFLGWYAWVGLAPPVWAPWMGTWVHLEPLSESTNCLSKPHAPFP